MNSTTRLITTSLIAAGATAGLIIGGAGSASAAKPSNGPTVTSVIAAVDATTGDCTVSHSWHNAAAVHHYSVQLSTSPIVNKGSKTNTTPVDYGPMDLNRVIHPGETSYIVVTTTYMNGKTSTPNASSITCPA